MARFRKVFVTMYSDAKFRSLSSPTPNAQTLWTYILTAPATTVLPGLLCIGEAALAEELGWKVEEFRKVFAEISAKGMAKADWNARVLWVPNAVKFNPPESPNVVRAWGKAWTEVPECALKVVAFNTLKVFVEGMPEGFGNAFREVFPKTLPNQEQEQEQDSLLSAGADVSDESEEAAASKLDADRADKPKRRPTKAKPAEDAKPEHGQVKAYFCERWTVLRGATAADRYPWKHGRDDKHLKWILDEVNRAPEKAKAIVEAFLRDDDAWLADKGHELSHLVSRFARYRARRPVEQATADNGFVRAEMTDDFLHAAFGEAGDS